MTRIRAAHKVGIAYSGGGDLLVVELGIARAFIELGIVPDEIAGTSAGAFTGAYHALDPRSLKYLALAQQLAAQGIPYLHPSLVRDFFRLVPAAIAYAFGGASAVSLPSIVDRSQLKQLLEEKLPAKTFGQLRVPLSVAATNLLDGAEAWFEEPAMPLIPALLASSAIPALFAPVPIGGQVYVDGSVSDNLPIYHLAQKGCSTIFAANVSYAGERAQAPHNLIDTAIQSINISLYHATVEQQQLLTARYPEIRVILVRPAVTLATLPSRFDPKNIPTYIERAAAETKRILLASGFRALPIPTPQEGG